MSRGFQSNKTRSGGGFIVRSALVLSIIAGILVGMIGLTVVSANHLMNIDKNYVTNVPSNILPSYSTTSFESADGQTTLSGWFFKTQNPITTIIVVHDTGSNRLQFGVQMIDMIETWLDNHYNVFLFDQRNSGESNGDISCYGYLEWQDVLGAIAEVKQISVTTDVVLYGIGTGCTSSIIAYNKLPDPGISEENLKQYKSNIVNLGFDKSYISGMVFDSPAMYSDDYIKPVVLQSEFLGILTQNFVPYAIRVSAGEENYNLATAIARLPIPLCIIYGGHDTFIGADKIKHIVSERNRLNSNITTSQMVSGAGYLEEYAINEEQYISTVMNYLNSYIIKE